MHPYWLLPRPSSKFHLLIYVCMYLCFMYVCMYCMYLRITWTQYAPIFRRTYVTTFTNEITYENVFFFQIALLQNRQRM
jgi:hypothetical protein